MNENALKASMLGLLGVTIISLSACVIAGHNSAVTDLLIAICGGSGVLGVWERLKK